MTDPGYSVVPALLFAGECEQLVNALQSAQITRSRAGARHLMSSPLVSALAGDRRLLGLAMRWLGPSAVPFRATLFEKSSTTNWLIPWHQDTALPLAHRFDAPGWGPWSEKAGALYAHAPAWALSRVVALRVHLDPSDSSNGPLRVIPGSHRNGVLSDDAVSQLAAHPHVECCVPTGGVIAMRQLIIHSSPKARGEQPRRVLHIEYADTLDLAPGVSLTVV